jgi:hypothetical protein
MKAVSSPYPSLGQNLPTRRPGVRPKIETKTPRTCDFARVLGHDDQMDMISNGELTHCAACYPQSDYEEPTAKASRDHDESRTSRQAHAALDKKHHEARLSALEIATRHVLRAHHDYNKVLDARLSSLEVIMDTLDESRPTPNEVWFAPRLQALEAIPVEFVHRHQFKRDEVCDVVRLNALPSISNIGQEPGSCLT